MADRPRGRAGTMAPAPPSSGLPQLGPDSLVVALQLGEGLRGAASARSPLRGASLPLIGLTKDILEPDSPQAEGPACAALIGDLGDEAKAIEFGKRGRARLPRPLLSQQCRRVGVQRAGEQVRAVRKQPV